MARDLMPPSADQGVKEWADRRLTSIEQMRDADAITIISPLVFGVEHRIRVAIEAREQRRNALLVILDTTGGVVEVVERIVRVFRRHYQEVRFLIPDRAMSAGTILAMSGDAILMDYHSCLGPIDPQIERDGRLVPALSYLSKYDELSRKAEEGTLTTADVVLLEKLDLAELHQFELARDLSITLLKEWLTTYKFKDWTKTETRGIPVTGEMKEERADSIARELNNHERWHTHGRGIDMRTLNDDLQLRIDDFGEAEEFADLVWDYFWFLRDHMNRVGTPSFIHSPDFF